MFGFGAGERAAAEPPPAGQQTNGVTWRLDTLAAGGRKEIAVTLQLPADGTAAEQWAFSAPVPTVTDELLNRPVHEVPRGGSVTARSKVRLSGDYAVV